MQRYPLISTAKLSLFAFKQTLAVVDVWNVERCLELLQQVTDNERGAWICPSEIDAIMRMLESAALKLAELAGEGVDNAELEQRCALARQCLNGLVREQHEHMASGFNMP